MTSRIDIRSIVPNNSLNVWLENSRQLSAERDNFRNILSSVSQHSVSSVFSPDTLSLGEFSSPYQTYSVNAVQQNKSTSTSPGVPGSLWVCWGFSNVARICISNLLSVKLGDYSRLPSGVYTDGGKWLSECERSFLQDFHTRILSVMQSQESRKAAMEGDDEINAIIARFAGEPLGYESFYAMMQEIWETGLFTREEFTLLRRAGVLGLTIEDIRLWQASKDGESEECDEITFSIPDLEELFLNTLDEHYTKLAEQSDSRDNNYEDGRVITTNKTNFYMMKGKHQ